jgi:hypothetical protein
LQIQLEPSLRGFHVVQVSAVLLKLVLLEIFYLVVVQ